MAARQWSSRKRGSGGYQTPRRGKCQNFKLLGSCYRGDSCSYMHVEDSRPKFVDYVALPDRLPMSLAVGKNANNFRPIYDKTECAIAPSQKHPREVKVVATNAQDLETVVVKLTDLFARLYPLGPAWCYLHTEGLKAAGGVVFSEYKGRLPTQYQHRGVMYEVCNAELGSADDVDAVLTRFQDLSLSGVDAKETLHKALEEKSMVPLSDRVRVVTEYGIQIKEQLRHALEWYLTKGKETDCHILKLEARFGKVLWDSLPDDALETDEPWTAENFTDFVFNDSKHNRVFNTNVQKKMAEQLGDLLKDAGECKPTLETYDIKLSISKTREKLDVRLKVNIDGQLEVVAVRKSEARIVCFDFICLHRLQDMRICLSQLQIVKSGEPFHDMADRLQKTIRLSQRGTLHFIPCTDEWSISLIRTKKRTSYVIEGKYIVTVSSVREHEIESRSRQQQRIDFQDFEEHYEVEIHNMAWDCMFGKDVHPTLESCLNLFMDEPVVDPMVLGCLPPPGQPWKPDEILKDVDEVLEQTEQINELLGEVDH